MPAKPGKTRRQPAAEGASAGGGETEEKTRARRGENVKVTKSPLETIFTFYRTLFLIFIFLFLLFTARLILSEFQKPSASLWLRTSPNREPQTIWS